MKSALRDDWTRYAESLGRVVDDAPAPKAQKYHAKVQFVDGIRFASKKEAARYHELKLMQLAGQIEGLRCQPEYPLHIMELFRSQTEIQIRTVGVYRPDFDYTDLRTGEFVVEDTKSDPTKTEAYRLRKKIAEAVHGIFVREV